MGNKFKSILLVFMGVVAGVVLATQISAQAQKPDVQTLPLQELRQLADVYGLIKSDYVEPVEDKKLLTDAISGMVSALDPHSAYLDEKAFKELKEGTRGRFGGLGIEVGMEDGLVKVIAPIEDTPAYRAGVQTGDLIIRLDEKPVKGMTLMEAVKLMRGDPGTSIKLTIDRKSEHKPVIVKIVREEIQVKSVKGKLVEPDYAWLRIAQFQQLTVVDLGKKLTEFYAENPALKGIVLDLRNDPGGVLPGAVGVSAAFLPKNVTVVTTSGQLEDSKATFIAHPAFYASRKQGDPLADLPAALKTVPLVVLINAGSASASEIVAGALQDYKRATIMGTRSFGKGSVQTVRQLSKDTGIKLTTARYYTPNGRTIQAKGIEPDIVVEETAEGAVLDALRVREADLEKHLSDGTDVAEEPKAEPEKRTEEEEERIVELAKKYKPLRYGSEEDFQLRQALNHLKGLPIEPSKAGKAEKADAEKKEAK